MPPKPFRRTNSGARCPGCGAAGVKRETTVKGRTVVVSWTCSACKKVWSGRRSKA